MKLMNPIIILSALNNNVNVGTEFTLEDLNIDPKLYRDGRTVLNEAQCVLTIAQGIRGAFNTYYREFTPTPETLDKCNGCKRIESGTSGCPINEAARKK